MKKVIITLLLIAVICVPVFAKENNQFNWNNPEVGVSASISFENGFKFNGIEVFGGYFYTDKMIAEARVGYLFSFDKDPAVSGLYVDLLVGNSKVFKEATEGEGPSATTKSVFCIVYKGGLGADFHIIDGNVKVNLGAEAGVSSYFYAIGGPEVSVRYNFVNGTDAPKFNLNAGASADVMPKKNNESDPK